MPRIRCGPPADHRFADLKDRLILHGPTIPIDIGLDRSWDANKPQTPPKLQSRNVLALIDTGAAINYIDAALALKLGLPEIDKEMVTPVLGGTKEIKTYLGQIHVSPLAFTIYGAFGGLDLASGGMRYSAILGREFLMHFSMSYDGRTGEVFLTG